MTRPGKATPMKPKKKLRKWIVYNINRKINRLNSADGQEITGVIPFFGESAFGSALQSGVLVVFTQHNIYLVGRRKEGKL